MIRCEMALTRGVKSLYPCPRCLIAAAKQGDLSATATLRTAEKTKDLVLRARKHQYAKDKEEDLKSQSLRDVDV
jgi:hypothetical protein